MIDKFYTKFYKTKTITVNTGLDHPFGTKKILVAGDAIYGYYRTSQTPSPIIVADGLTTADTGFFVTAETLHQGDIVFNDNIWIKINATGRQSNRMATIQFIRYDSAVVSKEYKQIQQQEYLKLVDINQNLLKTLQRNQIYVRR